jgi:hypothetical protein
VGGRTSLPDGGTIIWSVAEGRRGRRWRAVTTRDGATESDLLLETAADGRPTRLELATSSGLLTLHPENDGSALHGNTVTTAGVRHHTLPWSAGHVLLVERSQLVEAAAAVPLTGRLGVGEGGWFGSIVVDGALVPRLGQVLIVRVGASTFTLAMPSVDQERTITLDDAGLPTGGATTRWELEPA